MFIALISSDESCVIFIQVWIIAPIALTFIESIHKFDFIFIINNWEIYENFYKL